MYIVGIDEVGRGSLAGPLVVGAVILKNPIQGLRDSKLLTKNNRNILSKIIFNEAVDYGIGWVEPNIIDKIGLTDSIRLAISQSLMAISAPVKKIIIDGNYNFLKDDIRAETLIKADQLIDCVSAASIIAKVTRDTWMESVAARKFPNYSFETHVGYPTKLHISLIQKYGVCDIHRKSFRPVTALIY